MGPRGAAAITAHAAGTCTTSAAPSGSGKTGRQLPGMLRAAGTDRDPETGEAQDNKAENRPSEISAPPISMAAGLSRSDSLASWMLIATSFFSAPCVI